MVMELFGRTGGIEHLEKKLLHTLVDLAIVHIVIYNRPTRFIAFQIHLHRRLRIM